MSDTAVALITAGGAVAGALVGAIAGVSSSFLASRHARRDARADQRREAYAEFILRAGELTKFLTAEETLQERPDRSGTREEAIGKMIGSVDRAYVAVLLIGSKEARAAAESVRDHAWDILYASYSVMNLRDVPGVGEYAAASERFGELVRKELA